MQTQKKLLEGKWVLVLGASSGFGEAVCRKAAQLGANIAGVHLDRKSGMAHVESLLQTLAQEGNNKVRFFNANAADPEQRAQILNELEGLTGSTGVHALIHSLAFGTLKPFLSIEEKERVSREQMNMTLDVMAHSLVYWTQDLFARKLLRDGGRILAMTSAGSTRVWLTYGAVSAAKAALESHCRQLALELGKHGITVNAIRAGVTLTPALQKIPGHEAMIASASARNPSGRLTTTQDVADFVGNLLGPESQWVTGNVLGVDGGEEITG